MELKKAIILIISIQILCTIFILSFFLLHKSETTLTKPGQDIVTFC